MKSFAEIDQENNGNYLKLLSASAKLSKLFSESQVPYIYIIEPQKIYFVEVSKQKIFQEEIQHLMQTIIRLE